MSESNPSDRSTDEFLFSSKVDAETFIRTIMEHRGVLLVMSCSARAEFVGPSPHEPEAWPLEKQTLSP